MPIHLINRRLVPKMKQANYIKLLFITVLIGTLTACGGGSKSTVSEGDNEESTNNSGSNVYSGPRLFKETNFALITGAQKYKQVFEYDNQSRVKGVKRYDGTSDKKSLFQTDFEYNTDNQVISETTYQYDLNENKTKKIVSKNTYENYKHIKQVSIDEDFKHHTKKKIVMENSEWVGLIPGKKEITIYDLKLGNVITSKLIIKNTIENKEITREVHNSVDYVIEHTATYSILYDFDNAPTVSRPYYYTLKPSIRDELPSKAFTSLTFESPNLTQRHVHDYTLNSRGLIEKRVINVEDSPVQDNYSEFEYK